MPNARASADTFPPKYARASDLLMGMHYGDSHMAMHIDSSYRPATFDFMEKVGQRVRELRLAKGFNQKELAAKACVDQSTISDIETKEIAFSATILMRVADALEVSPSAIMRGQDDATWPFKHIPQARFLGLDAEQRAYIEGRLEAELDRLDSPPPPKPRTAVLRSSTKAPAAKRSGSR